MSGLGTTRPTITALRSAFRVVLAALAVVVLSGSAFAESKLYLHSQPGDYIGEGRTVTYTTGTFTVHGGGTGVISAAYSDPDHWWDLTFAALEGQVVVGGAYEDAMDYPFQSPSRPGLDVSGDGSGCGSVVGRFVVLELSYDAGGNVQTFAADFEQHCDGVAAALYGAIRINSSLPIAPQLTVAPTFAAEPTTGVGVLTFTVALSQPANAPVSVQFTTVDGTAHAGTDYTPASGTVTFAPGETVQRVTVEFTSDEIAAGDRTVLLDLSGASGAPLFESEGVGTILDSAGPRSILLFDSQPGDYIGQGVWQAMTSLDGDFNVQSSPGYVRVHFEGATWWDATFQAPSGDLVPGAYEGAMRWPFQDPGHPGLDVSGDGRGCNESNGRFDVLEISFDENGILQSFAADFEQHCEGGAPALFGSVRYHSTAALADMPLTVSAFGNGQIASTPAGIDCPSACAESYAYGTGVRLTAAAPSGSIFMGWSGPCTGTGDCVVALGRPWAVSATFLPLYTLSVQLDGMGVGALASSPAGIDCGSDCAEIYPYGTPVTLTATPDQDSSFTGWAGDCTGNANPLVVVVYGDTACTATFTHNVPALQFSAASYSVSEKAGQAVVMVTRAMNLSEAVTVQYATADGSARAGLDYTAESGSLSFAAGVTAQSFAVPILTDAVTEGLEIVNLALSSPSGDAVLGDPGAAVLQIVDSGGQGAVYFKQTLYQVPESGHTVKVTVQRSGSLAGPASVRVTAVGKSATAGQDFVPLDVTLSFPPQHASKSVTVTIRQDHTQEGPETFRLVLSNPVGLVLGTQRKATVEILDDDSAP